jgi:hypothetical protein
MYDTDILIFYYTSISTHTYCEVSLYSVLPEDGFVWPKHVSVLTFYQYSFFPVITALSIL